MHIIIHIIHCVTCIVKHNEFGPSEDFPAQTSDPSFFNNPKIAHAHVVKKKEPFGILSYSSYCSVDLYKHDSVLSSDARLYVNPIHILVHRAVL